MVTEGLRRRRAPFLAMALLLLGAGLAACDSAAQPLPPSPTDTTPVELTFGVWGSDPEIAAYQSVVNTYNESATGVHVTIQGWPDAEALAAWIRNGGQPPNVYLLARADLAAVTERGLNRPLLELVDERGVDFGDGYSREAVLAFSAVDELQCMPYGVSPMVIYYNKDLIDFDRMAQLELPAPTPAPDTGVYDKWDFDQFRAAAQFASRPRRGTKGIHIAPTLRGLAPFIYSGGGDVFDADLQPSSLSFSSDQTRDALRPTLELLRDPALTLTEEELSQASALKWFKRGKLAMIAGFRSVVPELRDVSDLDFDVMPMPSIDDTATVGDFTGLCISARPAANVPEAADFLVYVVSAEAVARVTAAGYLVPANLQVAASADFLQPDRHPASAQLFNSSIGDLRLFPLIDSLSDLEAAVREPLLQLLTMPVPDLEALTTQIDEESRALLDPELVTETPAPESDESN